MKGNCKSRWRNLSSNVADSWQAGALKYGTWKEGTTLGRGLICVKTCSRVSLDSCMLLISETCRREQTHAPHGKHLSMSSYREAIPRTSKFSLLCRSCVDILLLGRVFLKAAQFFVQAITSCIGKNQSTLEKTHRSPKAHRLTCRWFAE